MYIYVMNTLGAEKHYFMLVVGAWKGLELEFFALDSWIMLSMWTVSYSSQAMCFNMFYAVPYTDKLQI